MSRFVVSRRKLFWTLQIGGWAALIPLFVVLGIFAMPPGAAVANSVIRQVDGFVVTLGLAAIYRRWEWERFSLWLHGLAIVALSLAASAVDLAVAKAIFGILQLDMFPIGAERLEISAAIARSLIYISWSALYLALKYFLDLRDRDLRLAQAETDAREAELQALRAQLNPHFLFNALNSILAEADDNPARVKAITLNLSELLRFSLRQRDHFGPLDAEITAIENYLRVESSRFEERLVWRLDVDPAVRELDVPSSLLLPLVENAIKYGLQTSPQRLAITVSAVRRGDAIDACVRNSGHWIEPDPTATRSTGIGLNNLRRRLALLCGPAARVDISLPDGHVQVDLHVPIPEPAP